MSSEIYRTILTIAVPRKRHSELVSIFHWGLPALKSSRGFCRAFLCRELGHSERYRFIAEWRTRRDLESYLQTTSFRALLTVVDLSLDDPEICVEIGVQQRELISDNRLDLPGAIQQVCATGQNRGRDAEN